MLLYCHIRSSKTIGLLHIFQFDYIAQNSYDVITERIKRGPKLLYLTICSWELLHIALELLHIFLMEDNMYINLNYRISLM